MSGREEAAKCPEDREAAARVVVGRSRRRLVKICLMSLAVFAALYLGSYVILSVAGGHYLTFSGERRHGGRLAALDVAVWQPKYVTWIQYRSVGGDHRLRANALGYIYSPLIALDQAFFHKTRDDIDGLFDEDQAGEHTGGFTVDGRAIHPGCIWELGASIADPLPRIAAIDVKGIDRSNKYANSTIARGQDWVELRDADVLGTNAFFRYKPLGTLSNGTWALRTEECTGGTGVFMNVLLVRLERDRVYDHDRCRWRIVLKAVGSIGLGDRDDGTVELKGDAIILSKSKYRDEPRSITVPLE